MRARRCGAVCARESDAATELWAWLGGKASDDLAVAGPSPRRPSWLAAAAPRPADSRDLQSLQPSALSRPSQPLPPAVPCDRVRPTRSARSGRWLHTDTLLVAPLHSCTQQPSSTGTRRKWRRTRRQPWATHDPSRPSSTASLTLHSLPRPTRRPSHAHRHRHR